MKNEIAIFRGRHRSLTPLWIDQWVVEVGRSGRMVRLAPDIISGIRYGGDTLISEGLMGSGGVPDQSRIIPQTFFSVSTHMESLSPEGEVPNLKNEFAIFLGRHRSLTPLGINQYVIEVGRPGQTVRLTLHIIIGI